MQRIGMTLLACVSMVFVLSRDGAGQQRAPQVVSEQTFVAQAAMANMAEIQIGHLATGKAQSGAVKKFAQQMVEDHIKAQNALADAAQGGGIQWPKALDATHAATKARLTALSGADFDREYLRVMVDGHRAVEKALAARVAEPGTAAARPASATDPELTASVTDWSTKTLPVVREHLQKAEAVSAELGKAR